MIKGTIFWSCVIKGHVLCSVTRVGLHCVIVAFPDHAHFLYVVCDYKNCLIEEILTSTHNISLEEPALIIFNSWISRPTEVFFLGPQEGVLNLTMVNEHQMFEPLKFHTTWEQIFLVSIAVILSLSIGCF